MGAPNRPRLILFGFTLAAFLTPFAGSAVNVALPHIGEELGLSAIALSWVNLAYLIAAATLLLPFGRLADLRGRRAILMGGILLFALGSGLAGFARSGAELLLMRLLQGIGGALLFSASMPVLLDAFPPEMHGRVIGINIAGVYAGLSLGPVLGGWITQQWGWRTLFWLNGAVCLLLAALFLCCMRTFAERRSAEAFDWVGSALSALGLGALVSGLSLWREPAGPWICGSGALLLALFILYERRQEHPLLDLRLFSENRIFAFSNLAALINYSATFGVSFLLSLQLQHGIGLSPQRAGFVLCAQPAMQTLFSPLAGRLSDRIEPRRIASLGMALTTICLLAFAWLGPAAGIPAVTAVLLVLGFSFALFSSPNTRAVMGAVGRTRYGIASAVLGTMRLTGQMLSMAIAALIFAAHVGARPLATSFDAAAGRATVISFVVFAALCLIGTLASLARGRQMSRQPSSASLSGA
jgi:EmrB/QacA subfamily drug resistance transporter